MKSFKQWEIITFDHVLRCLLPTIPAVLCLLMAEYGHEMNLFGFLDLTLMEPLYIKSDGQDVMRISHASFPSFFKCSFWSGGGQISNPAIFIDLHQFYKFINGEPWTNRIPRALAESFYQHALTIFDKCGSKFLRLTLIELREEKQNKKIKC
jgi:hypothetical protein